MYHLKFPLHLIKTYLLSNQESFWIIIQNFTEIVSVQGMLKDNVWLNFGSFKRKAAWKFSLNGKKWHGCNSICYPSAVNILNWMTYGWFYLKKTFLFYEGFSTWERFWQKWLIDHPYSLQQSLTLLSSLCQWKGSNALCSSLKEIANQLFTLELECDVRVTRTTVFTHSLRGILNIRILDFKGFQLKKYIQN